MLMYRHTVESTTHMWDREPAHPDGVVAWHKGGEKGGKKVGGVVVEVIMNDMIIAGCYGWDLEGWF